MMFSTCDTQQLTHLTDVVRRNVAKGSFDGKGSSCRILAVDETVRTDAIRISQRDSWDQIRVTLMTSGNKKIVQLNVE